MSSGTDHPSMASSDPEEPRLACWKTFVPRQLGFCDRFCLEEDVLWGQKCPDLVKGKINGYAVSYETISRFLHWVKAFREIQVCEFIPSTFKKVCLTWFRLRVSIHHSLGFTWHPFWRCWERHLQRQGVAVNSSETREMWIRGSCLLMLRIEV